ncbi:hypothetical protein EVAR_68117_1 [Eumeta japonica]|uniref:Uncharacterized protein n=1 Tax=Eumeta variegata TaxID=151549 RepID=A0A4C1ZFH7_EUMVA|nr:hypothetical protein EVAR_68117_1 [Eumeta japonica]
MNLKRNETDNEPYPSLAQHKKGYNMKLETIENSLTCHLQKVTTKYCGEGRQGRRGAGVRLTKAGPRTDTHDNPENRRISSGPPVQRGVYLPARLICIASKSSQSHFPHQPAGSIILSPSAAFRRRPACGTSCKFLVTCEGARRGHRIRRRRRRSPPPLRAQWTCLRALPREVIHAADKSGPPPGAGAISRTAPQRAKTELRLVRIFSPTVEWRAVSPAARGDSCSYSIRPEPTATLPRIYDSLRGYVNAFTSRSLSNDTSSLYVHCVCRL